MLHTSALRDAYSTRESLEWKFRVMHAFVTVVHIRMVRGLGGRTRVHPKAQIEVWAEGDCGDGDEELAYCQGVARLGIPKARVVWLGRSPKRTVHEKIQGIRCITELGMSSACGGSERTIAQAVLGLFAGVCDLFGCSGLNMAVDDSGSGRLVEYYCNLGFVVTQKLQHVVLEVEAPTRAVSRLFPAAWFADLVPSVFDGVAWLCSMSGAPKARQTTRVPALRNKSKLANKCSSGPAGDKPGEVVAFVCQETPLKTCLSPCTPTITPTCAREPSRHAADLSPVDSPKLVNTCDGSRSMAHGGLQPITPLQAPARWTWTAPWPVGARVDMQLMRSKSPLHCHSLATLCDCKGEEMVSVRAAIPPSRKFIRVLWVGRSHARLVHPNVRGQAAYPLDTCPPEDSFSSNPKPSGDDRKVSAAVAMLGVSAALARALGIPIVELCPLDDGSGKLLQWFQRLGFQERVAVRSANTTEMRDPDNLWMEISCDLLEQNACPTDWSRRFSASAHQPAVKCVGGGAENNATSPLAPLAHDRTQMHKGTYDALTAADSPKRAGQAWLSHGTSPGAAKADGAWNELFADRPIYALGCMSGTNASDGVRTSCPQTQSDAATMPANIAISASQTGSGHLPGHSRSAYAFQSASTRPQSSGSIRPKPQGVRISPNYNQSITKQGSLPLI